MGFYLNSKVKKIYDPIISFLNKISTAVIIATTNYDRAIEQYCESSSLNFTDGFANVSNSYRWMGKDIPQMPEAPQEYSPGLDNELKHKAESKQSDNSTFSKVQRKLKM